MSIDQEIEENKNLVWFIIRRFYPTFADDEDVFQCGLIGLWKAIESFDKHKEFTLSTYAAVCIHNEIRMYLRKARYGKNDLSLDYNYDNADFTDFVPTQANTGWTDWKGFMASLTPLEQKVVKLRMDDNTLEEMAVKLGVSREWVRVLLQKARNKFDDYI